MYIGMCLNLDSTTFAVFAIKKGEINKNIYGEIYALSGSFIVGFYYKIKRGTHNKEFRKIGD